MKILIQEIIDNNIKIFQKEEHVDMKKVLFNIAKKYKFEIVDAYGSIRGKIPSEGEFFIPNSEGQEGAWDYDVLEFDFVILKKKEVIIVKYINNDFTIEHVFFNVKINFDDFGGKRAYYLHKNIVRFRTNKEFYQNLKDENKFPEGEENLSGPHFTIRF